MFQRVTHQTFLHQSLLTPTTHASIRLAITPCIPNVLATRHAGHNRWSQIKRAKGANDVARAKQFSKIATSIIAGIVAGKGEVDPGLNLYLASALAQARGIQMPKANVEGAIKKGLAAAAGKGGAEATGDEVVYEGMTAQGVSVVVVALSSNRNKTFAEVRHCFTKHDGALKSVMFQFEKRSRLVFGNKEGVEPKKTMDDLLNIAMELEGVDDIGEEVDDAEDPSIELFTTVPQLLKLQKQVLEQGLEVKEMDLVAYIPTSRVESLTEAQLTEFEKVLADLENQADVTKIFHNASISA
ncbi:YebC-like protein [Rhizoclosmatium globosum]|uniref:YebC-like protein n=1 Tax=Rhizoclosmatium globosum TaxID=329046 RepID=A0A1Y2CQJ1_9FUNG|nr:YebC-like protein [Rhizoclosmatium globosum]|eukprot:ORY49104.1 YebC-like protein [Rhizoclosmatium globosum]